MGRAPDGDAPTGLASSALAEVPGRPLSLYVHVPYCPSRCGYCDFNTYTAAELGSAPGTGQQAYLEGVRAEIGQAAAVLGSGRPQVSSVFFGGGTPTLLPAAELVGILGALRQKFAFADTCEVTTEANPETLSREYLAALHDGGFTRLSLGMQSAAPHVLATLERRHTPGRVADAVRWAREAGFASVSLDLIYGTPGESMDDWRTSLTAALACEPDHISAYALIVEEGTRFATRLRRGELLAPDDDDLADKYLVTEAALTGAGLGWYEVSNWARPGHECQHNLAYWRGDHWWGFGPGAHSHVGGVRWWNVAHPRAYSEALADGRSPALAQETLTPTDRHVETVLLETRLADGLPLAALSDSERARVAGFVERGLVSLTGERLRLTVDGRLLADAVVRDLLD